jgi:hypothetical protein
VKPIYFCFKSVPRVACRKLGVKNKLRSLGRTRRPVQPFNKRDHFESSLSRWFLQIHARGRLAGVLRDKLTGFLKRTCRDFFVDSRPEGLHEVLAEMLVAIPMEKLGGKKCYKIYYSGIIKKAGALGEITVSA